MMELTEDFLKLLQIALIVVGVLAIYFSYVTYNVTVDARTAERDSLEIGNSLLSSSCLTYLDTNGLFSEEKLDSIQSDSSCLERVYSNFSAEVDLQGSVTKWQFSVGTPGSSGTTTLSVAVKMSSGEVKPASLVVKV